MGENPRSVCVCVLSQFRCQSACVYVFFYCFIARHIWWCSPYRKSSCCCCCCCMGHRLATTTTTTTWTPNFQFNFFLMILERKKIVINKHDMCVLCVCFNFVQWDYDEFHLETHSHFNGILFFLSFKNNQ